MLYSGTWKRRQKVRSTSGDRRSGAKVWKKTCNPRFLRTSERVGRGTADAHKVSVRGSSVRTYPVALYCGSSGEEHKVECRLRRMVNSLHGASREDEDSGP